MKPIIIAGPSGVGKGTVCQIMLELNDRLFIPVSHTTRAMRRNEKNGREYWFVSMSEFSYMTQHDQFLEYANVHGNYYGTAKTSVMTAGGRLTPLFEIDVQGALKLEEVLDDVISIFIMPPGEVETTLRERLANRNDTEGDDLETRLRNAMNEVACADQFDHVVVNETGAPDETAKCILDLIHGAGTVS